MIGQIVRLHNGSVVEILDKYTAGMDTYYICVKPLSIHTTNVSASNVREIITPVTHFVNKTVPGEYLFTPRGIEYWSTAVAQYVSDGKLHVNNAAWKQLYKKYGDILPQQPFLDGMDVDQAYTLVCNRAASPEGQELVDFQNLKRTIQ